MINMNFNLSDCTELIWKEIDLKGATNYEVNQWGQVRNKKTQRQLRGEILRGYRYYRLYGSKGCFKVSAHRLVALSFVENPNPNTYNVINHKDGNKLNNHSSNLEWCTQAMNMRHAVEAGLMTFEHVTGENSARTNLTNQAVIEIYQLAWETEDTYSTIAEIYGTTVDAVKKIKNNKSWTHLTKNIQVNPAQKRLRLKTVAN